MQRWMVVAGMIAIAAIFGAVLVAWLIPSGATRPPATTAAPKRSKARSTHRIDFTALHDYAQRNRVRIAELRASWQRTRGMRAGDELTNRDASWDHNMRSEFEPCMYGPEEMCADMFDLADACFRDDAMSCVALAQFIEDTPPKVMIAISWWVRACKLGDTAACDRIKAVKKEAAPPGKCADDVLACTFHALRTGDVARIDEACALDSSDACTMLSWRLRDSDPDRSRALMENACRIGAPLACHALGHALSPGCEPTEDIVCYEPDSIQSATALAMACASGFAEACPD